LKHHRRESLKTRNMEGSCSHEKPTRGGPQLEGYAVG